MTFNLVGKDYPLCILERAKKTDITNEVSSLHKNRVYSWKSPEINKISKETLNRLGISSSCCWCHEDFDIRGPFIDSLGKEYYVCSV